MATPCPICHRQSAPPCACREDLRRVVAKARAHTVELQERLHSLRNRLGETPFRVVHLHIADDPNTTRVAFAGDIDVAEKHAFNAALDRAIEASSKRVLVDLSLVTFFNSTGVSALVTAHGLARSTGRELRLVRVPPHVRRVMEICDVWSIFNAVPIRAVS